MKWLHGMKNCEAAWPPTTLISSRMASSWLWLSNFGLPSHLRLLGDELLHGEAIVSVFFGGPAPVPNSEVGWTNWGTGNTVYLGTRTEAEGWEPRQSHTWWREKWQSINKRNNWASSKKLPKCQGNGHPTYYPNGHYTSPSIWSWYWQSSGHPVGHPTVIL